ncbi:uncharacterized protein KRP23_10234 [Phytophthora ramorum]|uniref:uncharacterized protein n=1 Tax=Phytophthora ramorum TaxID=164328 RepID=UPI003097BC0C|nr:hypothetical protein KRP23_10234 [Phytophthora ramorum]
MVESGEQVNGTAAAASAGETALSEMNAAFASCLSLVCPPIQYPPHCRFNPLEQLFLNDAADTLSSVSLETSTTDAEVDSEAGRQQQSELEMEVLNLEAEIAEKNDLIEKYTDVVRGWEGKFKRLDHRMSPDRE